MLDLIRVTCYVSCVFVISFSKHDKMYGSRLEAVCLYDGMRHIVSAIAKFTVRSLLQLPLQRILQPLRQLVVAMIAPCSQHVQLRKQLRTFEPITATRTKRTSYFQHFLIPMK